MALIICPLAVMCLSVAVSLTSGLRCYVCNGMEFDSPNPQLSNIYKQISTQCNLTDDTLVTCPSPQPGNVVKCGTSTTQMAATSQGYALSGVLTVRRCLEVADAKVDGCTDIDPASGGVTIPPALSAFGVEFDSLNVTDCICSGDGCNNNNNTFAPLDTTTLSSVEPGRTTAPGKSGIQCYNCSDVLFMSTNPGRNSSFAKSNHRCSLTAEEMVTCPSPRPGYVAKCYTSTAHIDDTYNGFDRYGVVTGRSCWETPVDEVDGCKDEDRIGAVQTLSHLNLKKYTAEGCFCSDNQCNNKAVAITLKSNGQTSLRPALTISVIGLVLASALKMS